MKIIKIKILAALLMSPLFAYSEAQDQEEHTVLQEKLQLEQQDLATKKKSASRRKKNATLVNFYFDNEDLVDIINFIAGLRQVNVLLPMGANTINAKVTLHLEEKVTLEEAWDILYTLLDVAGYSLITQENMYRIVKTTKDVVREALPLFVVKPEQLPDNDKRIRYLYYFSNIKVGEESNNEIVALLQNVLPETAWYRLDPFSNSLLITDKANDIKAVMRIVTALDNAEAQEKPEIIRLRYLSADFVANLLGDMLKASAADTNPLRPDLKRPSASTYFSKKLRIVPDMRNNALIVFGRPQATERVRDFIHKYIDVELESGKSILHTYQLQYLEAESFAKVLENIVKSTRPGGTEQSRTAAATAGGTERFFEEVVIKADAPRTVTGDQPGGAMLGSNNLVIAARSDDWERIKKLIEELDTPQPQVIIEVLIADLTLVEQRALGVSMRNPLGLGLANGVNIQSAQIEPFLVDSVSNPTTIAGDLLRRGYAAATGAVSANCDPGGTGGGACVSAASLLPQGTAVLSLNDVGTGQTWAIGQIRNAINNKKVLLHPHLITTNNKKAELVLTTEKLLVDEGSGSTGGTTTQTRKWIPATISVKITPRISTGGMVNLNVAVEINQFTNSNTNPNNADSGNKNTRNVITNANVRSGNVLALGGLTRADSSASQNQTPWLGNIPIIGWFFKNRNSEVDKNNLTVFISPIIIEPRLRGGVGEYTKEYVQLAKSYSNEGGLFDGLRDPITRWFFKPMEVSVESPVDEFVSQDELIAPTLFDTRVEQKKALVQTTPAPIPQATQQPELKDLVAGLDTNPFAQA